MKKHLVVMVICASTLALLAQQPKVSNTNFTAEPTGGTLTATVDRFRRSSEQRWLGYEVPALPQSHFSACSNWSNASSMDDECCGEYRLEDDANHTVNRGNQPATEQHIYVLLRMDHGQIIKVRTVMAGCHLDAGGVPFTWLTGVNPEDSVVFLSALATQSSESNRSHVVDGALYSISYHATPAATNALSEIASSTAPMHLREQAAFWLGVERGHEGFLALQFLERNAPEPAFREKLPFDFSQNSDPAAEDELLRMARSDPDAKVREQALFWLAQKAGKKATAALTEAIQNDPETEVKKKAVFALSQLPKEESVPQLIHVADTNSNPAVRKEAFFWLGQSHDPRALAYLEQVLKR
jgi:HEAT repeat protein